MSPTTQQERLWHRAHRLAPQMLIFAWVVFSLSSALLPCHEAIDAFGSELLGDAPLIVVAPQLTHGGGTAQLPHSDHTSHLACENPANAAPESTGPMGKLITWHPTVKWAASDAPFPTFLAAAGVPDKLVPYWIPPPQYRFYARTLRLLI